MKQIILYCLLFISSHLFGQETVEDFNVALDWKHALCVTHNSNLR